MAREPRSLLVKTSVLANSSTRSRAAARPYWLFALFAVYGPSIGFGGELRYVEIIVLLLLFLNIRQAIKNIGPWEKGFVALFMVAALAHWVSDMVNDASVEGTIKRTGTYIMLAFLVPALKLLSRDDPVRIQWMVLGYCASYIFILYTGQSFSSAYEDDPIRLGLGTAATIAFCVLFWMFPRYDWFAGPVLLAVAALLAMLLARSMAAITALTGVMALAASLKNRQAPRKFRPGVLIGSALAGALCIAAAYLGVKEATDAKLFPEELQARMELQFSNPYGLLAAGRPDVLAGAYAAWKRPWLGHGSTNVDPEVYDFYTEVAASTYLWSSEYAATMDALWRKQYERGTPSHSHLFGAWADAGLLAALCWMAALVLCGYVASRTMLWRDPRAPLFLFIALTTVWDVLFSPGPHRMDMAIRLMILIYAVDVLLAIDRRRYAGPGGFHSNYTKPFAR